MPKTVPVFWTRWIVLLGLFLIVYGLAMILLPGMMNDSLIGPLLYNSNPALRSAFASVSQADRLFLNVIGGLLGTVTVGWAIQIIWMAHAPFRRGEAWAWNALAVSLAVWAALEFTFKLAAGIAGVGLFAHFGLLAAFALPLLATYRYFYPVGNNDTSSVLYSERE
jgi:hypothetical protein